MRKKEGFFSNDLDTNRRMGHAMMNVQLRARHMLMMQVVMLAFGATGVIGLEFLKC